MALSVIGPSNNIWGPGLAFDAITSNGPPFHTDNRLAVTFTTSATESTFDIVAEASAFVRGDGQSTLRVGSGVITQAGAYRAGQSAGGEVWIHIHETDPAGGDVQAPQTVGPVSWDPALQLFKMIGTGSGGGLTPEQAAQLQSIFNSVQIPMHNSP